MSVIAAFAWQNFHDAKTNVPGLPVPWALVLFHYAALHGLNYAMVHPSHVPPDTTHEKRREWLFLYYPELFVPYRTVERLSLTARYKPQLHSALGSADLAVAEASALEVLNHLGVPHP